MLTVPTLRESDAAVADTIEREQHRQRDGIELIASENFVSAAVMRAVGSVLTNKYAEGYPRKRYYGGCEFVDEVEALAIERAKELFAAEHANVQPHSGASANMAAYLALLQPGDRILGLSLQEGGHLTHGLAVNFSGRLFEAHFYGVDPGSGLLDYDAIAVRARKYGRRRSSPERAPTAGRSTSRVSAPSPTISKRSSSPTSPTPRA